MDPPRGNTMRPEQRSYGDITGTSHLFKEQYLIRREQ